MRPESGKCYISIDSLAYIKDERKLSFFIYTTEPRNVNIPRFELYTKQFLILMFEVLASDFQFYASDLLYYFLNFLSLTQDFQVVLNFFEVLILNLFSSPRCSTPFDLIIWSFRP